MGNSVPEKIIASVFALLPNGTQTAIGEREKEAYAKPPRVVAVPRGSPGEFRQPDQPGNTKQFTDAGRKLLVRDFEIHWSVHNVDFETTESLFLNTVRAIRKVAHHSVKFYGESWDDQQEQSDGFEKFGSVISFVSTIELPIYEAASVLVPLTANPKIQTTVVLPEDGSGETVIINEG